MVHIFPSARLIGLEPIEGKDETFDDPVEMRLQDLEIEFKIESRRLSDLIKTFEDEFLEKSQAIRSELAFRDATYDSFGTHPLNGPCNDVVEKNSTVMLSTIETIVFFQKTPQLVL